MKKNILIRTNMFVCGIIVLGFFLTSYISYHSNLNLFEEDVAHVSNLASDGIFYRIKLIFSEPVNVSLTMANDSLLKEFLSDEPNQLQDNQFVQRMREYLHAYHKKYNYDSVFLVSTQTKRYYHINGLDRVLAKENPENDWFYKFIADNDEYSLNVDNDEATNNEITVFINCKIRDAKGAVLGVVGVGFRVNYLQAMLKKYEVQFGVQAFLVNSAGIVELSSQKTGYEKASWLEEIYPPMPQETILQNKTGIEKFWGNSSSGRSYITSRYVQNLDWHLIVQNSTSQLNLHFNQQVYQNILIISLIVLSVLFTITRVIHQYNQKIITLTSEQQRSYYEMQQQSIQQLYENVYEIDITHNRGAGEHTERYFESLGFQKNIPFDEALRNIAEKQLKEEYREGYINTFSTQNVLHAYQNGIKTLRYEFMTAHDARGSWMRIIACIYFLSDDESIHMTSYQQNIDDEKKYEKKLIAQIQSDPLTGLYNKAATEGLISEMLASASPDEVYAFFILDIDDFKNVNDTLGHAAGDYVIATFAQILKQHFRDTDIVGRIGGDEFVVFLKSSNNKFLYQKADSIVEALHRTIQTETWQYTISTSIGISVFPAHGTSFATLYKNADTAMYKTKRKGKNGYTFFTE